MFFLLRLGLHETRTRPQTIKIIRVKTRNLPTCATGSPTNFRPAAAPICVLCSAALRLETTLSAPPVKNGFATDVPDGRNGCCTAAGGAGEQPTRTADTRGASALCD